MMIEYLIQAWAILGYFSFLYFISNYKFKYKGFENVYVLLMPVIIILGPLTIPIYFIMPAYKRRIVKKAFNDLYDEIKHGDDEHQKWLKDKMEDFLKQNYND